MSLINDALKRASKPSRPAEAPGAGPLQPVAESSQGAGPLPLILLIVGIGALLGAGAFWLKAKSTTTAAAPVAPVIVTQIVERVVAHASPQLATNSVGLAQTPVVLAQVPVVTKPIEPPAAVAKVPVPPAPATEPELKLQAVYYRMKGPTVVINGQTWKVGDSIDGAKVLGIERTGVLIEHNGVVRRLSMQ